MSTEITRDKITVTLKLPRNLTETEEQYIADECRRAIRALSDAIFYSLVER